MLVIRSGGLNWSDAVLGPLLAGLRHALLEAGLDQYLQTQQNLLKRKQMETMQRSLSNTWRARSAISSRGPRVPRNLGRPGATRRSSVGPLCRLHGGSEAMLETQAQQTAETALDGYGNHPHAAGPVLRAEDRVALEQAVARAGPSSSARQLRR